MSLQTFRVTLAPVQRLQARLTEGFPVPGPPGPPGASSSVFFYRADANGTSATDPGAGTLRWNNPVQAQATLLYADVLTADDFDASLMFRETAQASRIIIHDADVSENFQSWKKTGPVTEYPDWFAVPVEFIESGGAGVFAHNSRIAVFIVNEGQGQTPWAQDVDAAGFALHNAAQIESRSGGFKFPDGTVQISAATVRARDLDFSGLPESPEGLPKGRLWLDGGLLKVVHE